jgi:hypothetical protein
MMLPPTLQKIQCRLEEMFSERIMSHFEDVVWPPRSPDLTACDFILWGYLMQKVYVNRPNTIQDLKDNIQAEIAQIPQDTMGKVTQC